MAIYRWGIIGCGNVTEVKSGPAYQQTDGFELSAVMRRDYAKANDYAKRHQVPKVYEHAEDLINDPDIDAVYIATPPDSHEYYAMKVAKAKKICCIEKPMAPSYAACVRINTAFRDQNLPLFVAYYRRSLPRFQQLKTWIDAHKIGEIRHIHWSFCKAPNTIDLSQDYNWRTDADIAPGGYFDDLASHGLDLFSYLLGDIIKAQGIAVNQQGLYSAKDAITGNWLHQSGITGSGSWNFGSETREDDVQIFGSQGKIIFSIFANQPILLTNNGSVESVTIEHPKHIQHYHVQNIKKHLLHEAVHPSTGESAAHTAWVMEQILK